MESQVQSEKILTYHPTIDDLKNFKEYVKMIRSDGVYAAKVRVNFVFYVF